MHTVTVQKVWSNDQNKALGKFVGTDGNTYFLDAAVHATLTGGETLSPPSVRPSDYNGKTNYFFPKGWKPPVSNGLAPPAAQPAPPRPAATGPAPANGYVPEQEKQGYIMCSVIMKILAEAQTQSGSPPNTEDMALFAQCATTVWRDHLKGKV
jgi:hypothetical protein